MITLDNKVNLTFSNMGLFDTESPWTHPVVTIDSFELIFVTEGTVSLYEGDKNFELNKGEMILLFPGVTHPFTGCIFTPTAFRIFLFPRYVRPTL